MTENTDNSIKESLSALIDGECRDSEIAALLDAIEGQSEHFDSQSANQADYSRTEFNSPSSLRETLKRYYLAQAIVNKDIHVSPSIDLSVAIASAIAKEDAPPITNVNGEWTQWKTWREWVGKTAIAASVAFGFVAGVQYFNPSLNDYSQPMVADKVSAPAAVTGANVPQGFELPPLSARTVSTGQSSNNAQSPNMQMHDAILPPSSPVLVTPVDPANAFPAGTIVIRNGEVSAKVNRLIFKHAEQTATSGALGVIPYARVSDVEPAEGTDD